MDDKIWKLLDDEYIYQQLFSHSPFSIIVFSPDGLVLGVNVRSEILLNTPANEIVGKYNVMKDPEAVEKGYGESFRRALRGEISRMVPTSYNTIRGGYRGHKDAPIIWTETTHVPLYDRLGNIIYIIAYSVDVTGRVEAEHNLYQAYDHLETMVYERTIELTRAHQELQQTNERLTRLVYELEQSNREMALLNQMGSFLQRSQSLEEAYNLIKPLLRQIFPNQSGALYISNAKNQQVGLVMSWGDDAPTMTNFPQEHCWALRGGRIHLVEQETDSLQCPHVDPNSYPYICAQLFSRGETLGLLHLRKFPIQGDLDYDRWERLTMLVSDRLSQAIANIQLRQQLREQSIRDPLTGLFNRRYLDEILETEIQLALDGEYAISIIMADIDHFKRCNDSYGHEAGDYVLRSISSLLQLLFHQVGTVCRFGGEEFLIILPDTSLEEATAQAWNLCNQVRAMPIQYADTQLNAITISLGVASYPQHGVLIWNVINVADAALYRAKGAGRDRVCVARMSN